MKRWLSGIWRTVLYSVLAGFAVFFLWGCVQFFGGTPHADKLLLLIPFSFLADALLAFFLPVVTVGIASLFQDEWNDYNLDFLLRLALGIFFTLLGMAIQWIVNGSAIIPALLVTCVMSILIFFDDASRMDLIAVAVGSWFAAFFLGGIAHGWAFPWALVFTLLTKWFFIPWYMKGFIGDEKSKEEIPRLVKL